MLPILYSYRRCPYAIRARMTLNYAGIQVEHREIELRNKPKSMLMASPKGTVPVLIVGDLVLDQSLEIMRWALQYSDPDNWGGMDDVAAQIWIERNDGHSRFCLINISTPIGIPISIKAMCSMLQ